MRQFDELTDEKRFALLNEYLTSGKSRSSFSKEKGLGNSTISRWLRTFAVEKMKDGTSKKVLVK